MATGFLRSGKKPAHILSSRKPLTPPSVCLPSLKLEKPPALPQRAKPVTARATSLQPQKKEGTAGRKANFNTLAVGSTLSTNLEVVMPTTAATAAGNNVIIFDMDTQQNATS
ncbi:MAG: hypothetical protein WA231_08170 [Methylocella sp.]